MTCRFRVTLAKGKMAKAFFNFSRNGERFFESSKMVNFYFRLTYELLAAARSTNGERKFPRMISNFKLAFIPFIFPPVVIGQ
jgi:hypothetical protein